MRARRPVRRGFLTRTGFLVRTARLVHAACSAAGADSARRHNRAMSSPGARLPIAVDPRRGPWPLHDTAAARASEAAALAANAPHALMEAAGLAVARLALARFAPLRRVEILAGPGNNGGDGFVAARHLHARGVALRVRWIGDADRAPDDARHAIAQARAAGVAIEPWQAEPIAADADLVVDALLGLGSRRAPRGAPAEAIDAIAAAGRPVLAVDLPSGLHADSGQLLGPRGVRADATLALLTLEPGLFTALGRDHAGEVWFDDLGAAATPPTAWLAGAPDLSWQRGADHAAHKGAHGDLVVVGGAPGMVGAAWLAARAALAAGAGRVYASLLDAQAASFDATRPELMARSAWWHEPAATIAAATVVCGCGGGARIAQALPPLLAHAPRLVLDADGLNALACDTALQRLLRTRAAHGLATLLTPHPLEAARLLGTSSAAVQSDRLAAAAELARRCAATVVLKGSGSIVAAPDALPSINPTGNAALATAGTGDVLAGWAGGLWARRPAASAFEVASVAAWQHGHAADRHRAAGIIGPLRAADLIESLAVDGGAELEKT